MKKLALPIGHLLIQSTDPVTLAAGCVPASRASRLDPSKTLRGQ